MVPQSGLSNYDNKKSYGNSHFEITKSKSVITYLCLPVHIVTDFWLCEKLHITRVLKLFIWKKMKIFKMWLIARLQNGGTNQERTFCISTIIRLEDKTQGNCFCISTIITVPDKCLDDYCHLASTYMGLSNGPGHMHTPPNL